MLLPDYILLDIIFLYCVNTTIIYSMLAALQVYFLVRSVKNRITFLVIPSKSGKQKRYSISRSLLYGILGLCAVLLLSGIVGAWKYRENIRLQNQSELLEAEKAQLEAVNRTVEDIKRDEVAIRKLLGLEKVNGQQENP